MNIKEIRAYILAYLYEAEKREILVNISNMASRIIQKAGISDNSARNHIRDCEKIETIEIVNLELRLTTKGRNEVKNIQYSTTEEI